MNEPKRPLPNAEEFDTGPFWQATKNSELRYQQCRNCETIVFYPRQHCTGCIDGELEWKTASGKGTVYTYSIVRQSYHPFFRNQVPYAVAWIDLVEGPRLISNVTGVDDVLNDIQIGMPVQVTWEEHDDLNIPLFKPA